MKRFIGIAIVFIIIGIVSIAYSAPTTVNGHQYQEVDVASATTPVAIATPSTIPRSQCEIYNPQATTNNPVKCWPYTGTTPVAVDANAPLIDSGGSKDFCANAGNAAFSEVGIACALKTAGTTANIYYDGVGGY